MKLPKVATLLLLFFSAALLLVVEVFILATGSSLEWIRPTALLVVLLPLHLVRCGATGSRGRAASWVLIFALATATLAVLFGNYVASLAENASGHGAGLGYGIVLLLVIVSVPVVGLVAIAAALALIGDAAWLALTGTWTFVLGAGLALFESFDGGVPGGLLLGGVGIVAIGLATGSDYLRPPSVASGIDARSSARGD